MYFVYITSRTSNPFFPPKISLLIQPQPKVSLNLHYIFLLIISFTFLFLSKSIIYVAPPFSIPTPYS
jgi:hypothetical protein